MDFKQAEKRFKQLKAQFTAGNLSEGEFKTQLEELMLQDEQGNWWMIGYETEKWYHHNGKEWVQADPLGTRSKISTPPPLKREIGTKISDTNLDDQRCFWKFGKKEIIQSSIGLGIVALLYPLFQENNDLIRYWPPAYAYWSPAYAVHLFFGLAFGPIVGAIVGAGRYIIPIFILYLSYHGMPFSSFLSTLNPFSVPNTFNGFSSIAMFSFVIEGFIIGLAMPQLKNYLSFSRILRAGLFITLANLIRFLLSWDLGWSLRSSPDFLIESLKRILWYPLIGGLILVPIALIVYSAILSRRKARS